MEDISKMKTQCPKCKASGKIDDSKIPEKGVYVRCPKCNERFYLQREIQVELEQPQEIEFGNSNTDSSKSKQIERKDVEPRDNKNYSTDKNEDKHPTENNEDIADKQNAGKPKVSEKALRKASLNENGSLNCPNCKKTHNVPRDINYTDSKIHCIASYCKEEFEIEWPTDEKYEEKLVIEKNNHYGSFIFSILFFLGVAYVLLKFTTFYKLGLLSLILSPLFFCYGLYLFLKDNETISILFINGYFKFGNTMPVLIDQIERVWVYHLIVDGNTKQKELVIETKKGKHREYNLEHIFYYDTDNIAYHIQKYNPSIEIGVKDN
jgi:predicted Zn finger-like uncharacterized protein